MSPSMNITNSEACLRIALHFLKRLLLISLAVQKFTFKVVLLCYVMLDLQYLFVIGGIIYLSPYHVRY